MRLGLCILAVLAIATAVASEEVKPKEEPESTQTPLPSDLEEKVEVVEPLPTGEDPASFQTRLDTEEVGSRGQDLADLFRRVPGARVQDYGGLGSYATLSMRASTAEQVTVLVDGVPQNRALGGPVDLSSIPATQVEEINVFRGFGAASLGLGGVGGLVDIRTKPAGSTHGVQVQADLLGGGYQTGRLAASLAVPTGESRALRFDVEALATEGNFWFLDTGGTFFNADDDVVRRRENNDIHQTALRFQHAWERIGPSQVRVALNLQDRDRGVPWIDNLPTSTARLENRLADLTTVWNRRGRGSTEDLEVVFNAFEADSRFLDENADFGAATDRTTQMRGAGLAGVWRVSTGKHNVTTRADGRWEQARVRDALLVIEDRGGAERSLLGLTVEDMVSLGRWTVSPSLRWDLRDDEFIAGGGGTLPPPAEDLSEDALSGKIGVVWAAGPKTNIRGSIGSFYRAPSLRELFGNRGALRGNPDLRSERGRAAEVGVVHGLSRGGFETSIEIVGFGRRTEDLIHFRQQSQGVAVAVNLLDTEVYGVEALASLSWRNGVWLDASLTRQRATDVSGGPFDGQPLIYHPERLGYAGVRW
ncbi:MAG: TonB-dependent receptor, partial [Acidobacteriota bacterium]|nr:TonB-dependent receptor [Acidobacteriota bacterium]